MTSSLRGQWWGVVDPLVDLVGHMPLVWLRRFSAGGPPTLLAKVPHVREARRPAELLPHRRPADRGDPGAFQPNQYFNPANPEAHYRSTGPEIRQQTGGLLTCSSPGWHRRDHYRRGRYLKERNPGVVVVGADPEGSIYSGEVHSYLVEGVGEDFMPATFDPSLVDRFVRASDRDSFPTARRLTREEGLLVRGRDSRHAMTCSAASASAASRTRLRPARPTPARIPARRPVR